MPVAKRKYVTIGVRCDCGGTLANAHQDGKVICLGCGRLVPRERRLPAEPEPKQEREEVSHAEHE